MTSHFPGSSNSSTSGVTDTGFAGGDVSASAVGTRRATDVALGGETIGAGWWSGTVRLQHRPTGSRRHTVTAALAASSLDVSTERKGATMPTADVNGQRIAYDDTGGDGPAVIFSHGFLMDRTMFADQVAALSDTYRCITWDERGFGDTPADAPFTYWDSAADAVALLDHLGIDRAVFVGMSQGGYLSLRAALAYPDRVAGLVLIDSGVQIDDEETLAGYAGMIDHWLSDQPLGEVGQMVAGLILGEPELMKKWIGIWESRDRSTVAYPAEALLNRDDISDRVQEITCPVLIIHGEEDLAIPIETARRLCADLPDCRGFVAVPGAAHASNMTHPEIVNPAIAEFLAAVT